MSLLLTAPMLQGFVDSLNASKDLGLEFPTPALRSRIALPLDVLMSEGFSKRNEVTSDPVETGEDVNAHVIRKPDTVVIDAIVSDTPVSLYFVEGFPARPKTGSAVKAAISFFDALVESRQPFDFIGDLLYYKGYVFNEWNVVKRARDGSQLHFTATMQKLNIVSSQLVPGSSLSPAAGGRLRNASKTSKGTVQVQPTPPGLNSMTNRWMGGFQSLDPTAGTL